MAIYLKVQENFHSINIRLTAKGRRKLTKRLKKAVKSRWLSFDQAVSSMIDEFQVVVHTVRELDEPSTVLQLMITLFFSLNLGS